MTSLNLRSARYLVFAAGLACAAPLWAENAPAKPAGVPAPDATTPVDRDLKQAQNRAQGILKALKLEDATKADAVRDIVTKHYQALQAWHREHDAELKVLWSRWAEARTPPAKDEDKAEGVAAEIYKVYATFRPQHEAYLKQLSGLLAPEQIETVKDAVTRSPGMMRTYKAYLEMVPQFKEEEKAYILERMKFARETAMDAVDSKEIINLFKVQKVKVERYIDTQGYDYRKSYKAWIDRTNNASKKPAKEKKE